MKPSVAHIRAKVASRFARTPADLIGPCRKRKIVRPRQVAIYLARNIAHRTAAQIGRMFGNRHTSTIFHAIHQVERLRAEDSNFDADVRALERELGA